MKRAFLFLAIFAILSAALFSAGRVSKAQTEIADAKTIGPDAVRQIEALVREKATRTPAQRKIDSQLLFAKKMHRGVEVADGIPSLKVDVGADLDGKVEVVISARIGNRFLSQLARMGVTVKQAFPEYNALSAVMSLDQLEAVAGLEQVRFIQPKQGFRLSQRIPSRFKAREFEPLTDIDQLRILGIAPRIEEFLSKRAARPETATQVGIAASQGDITHRAFSARGTFNTDGSGIKIGVLSDGVNSLADSQATGDLGSVTVLEAGFGDEGTAMLEIIHDLAPGAQLYFATGISGMAGFAQNIRALRNAGCDIIVDDLGYYVESPFQDGQASGIISQRNGGIVTQAVNDVVASGALYFSAAGNSGNKNDGTSGTWEGDFVNSGPLSPRPDDFPLGNVHDFDPSNGVAQFNTFSIGAGAPIFLHWSDPLGASANDYDYYVVNSTGAFVYAASTNIQDGTQDPIEGGTLGGGSLFDYRLVIVQNPGASNRFMHVENFGGGLTYSTNGEVFGHSAASGGIGVAAVPAVPTYPGSFNPSNQVEIYSSDGPRRMFFNADGTAITPGNVSATGGTLFQQPVLSAADGVNVSGAGGFDSPFFGTSAAAPHAAAIAALIKSASPSLTSSQIRNAMTSTAIDIETLGVDQDSGYGIAMPYPALQSLGGSVVGKAFLEIGSVTQTEICCNGDGFIVPGESANLGISLKNTGLLNASGITATLTTSTAGVTIRNGNSAYANIAAANGSTNITPFSVSLSPGLPPDPKIRFTLTMSYVGGHSSTQVWDFDVQFGFQSASFESAANSTVYAIALQPDGKVLVGGNFAGLDGLNLQNHSGIGRLNADGTLDAPFNPGCNQRVLAIAVQPDGKIIIGGVFTALGGGGFGNTLRSRIGRLNPDGTLDLGFNPGAFPVANYPFAAVWALLIQPDGKILVGGDFSTLGGQPRSHIGRLNSDGSLDTTFNPGADWPVRSFALQPDGKIIVVGDFEMIGGGGTGSTPRKKIARLNQDGTVDPSFNPGALNPLFAVALQSDGKIVVSGGYREWPGYPPTFTPLSGYGRINPDGTDDQTFDRSAFFVSPQSFGLQTDGHIVVGGAFSSYGGVPVTNFIAGLNPDGTLNSQFDPGANDVVFGVTLDGDGMVLVGGAFTTLGRGGWGQDFRNRIGRVSNISRAGQQLWMDAAGTTINWSRSGTSPEVYWVTFESSSDGTNYTPLGIGTRTASGWQLTGLTLTQQQRFIRARGLYTSGFHNGSVSIVESILFRGPTTVSGRVSNATGRGITNAQVTVTGGALSQPVIVLTGRNGQYSFPDLQSGQTYTISVVSRRYTFSPPSRLIVPQAASQSINFIAVP